VIAAAVNEILEPKQGLKELRMGYQILAPVIHRTRDGQAVSHTNFDGELCQTLRLFGGPTMQQRLLQILNGGSEIPIINIVMSITAERKANAVIDSILAIQKKVGGEEIPDANLNAGWKEHKEKNDDGGAADETWDTRSMEYHINDLFSEDPGKPLCFPSFRFHQYALVSTLRINLQYS
jgi:hypothetical protein